ncbi:MAG: hypothetical protein J3Q66DRAFT_365516 [Benniella sp.]|nr:MAG: hypothetical protein J3Q66DRAFT_365516 [Benniella sp.]
MLSSHRGKPAPTPTASSNTPQPYYSGDGNDDSINENDQYGPGMNKDGVMNDADNTGASPRRLSTKGMDKTQESSPMKQHTNTMSNMMDIFSPSVKPASISFAERLQRKDLLINTDLQLPASIIDQSVLPNTPHSPVVHLMDPSFQQQFPCSLSSMDQQYLPLQISRVGKLGDDNHNSSQCDTPPSDCILPMSLSRRASLANAVISPPPSTSMIKSATTHALFSVNDRLGNADRVGEMDPSKSRRPKRRSSLSNVTRRHSSPNNLHGTTTNTSATPLSITIQKSAISSNVAATLGNSMNTSYLPTPTEIHFRGSISGDSSLHTDISTQVLAAMPGFVPPTPVDPSILASGIHPFDLVPAIGTADPWTSRDISGISAIPLPMSMATKSATIQYLQQLQQSMMQQPDIHGLTPQPRQQQTVAMRKASMEGTSLQSKQQKSGQQGAQSRQGSKAKAKRRTNSVSATPQVPSYMSAEMPWSSLSSQTQQIAAQSALSLYQCSSADARSLTNIQPVTVSNTYYHGPAPCGNLEPLYEYLASPTIVPGLEIIGHDYYGNYVQILPICPETTCSMNQDPVYLNLLQAIYAHTIPFLDLAPGSEEETQRLLNGTPSAIATQSIQPPFKHLVPLNGPVGTSAQNALGKQATLTTSVSSPMIPQSSGNSKLSRRASMASVSSTTHSLSSRRSSIVSNASNPAKKKKNAPRTHPYKSTSVFKQDNAMVTEAILTQVGGLGGIGNSTTVSATDPRHKVAEKMVHMDEAEYTAHYLQHHQSMNKSALASSLCLAQTLAASMTGSSQGQLTPSSLMPSSVSAPSIANVTMSNATSNTTSPLESIAAADFIRVLSECNGGMSDLGLGANEPEQVVPDMNFIPNDLASLENLMMMDSNTAAAVQAAAATAWPQWFDLNQLEKDVCQEGPTHQAPALLSASCSMNDLALSNSTTLASFGNSLSRDNTSTNLLLSSSTHLAMMDDLLADVQPGPCSLPSSQDSEMALAVPASGTCHQNSASQVLVFDDPVTPSTLPHPENNQSNLSACSVSSSVSSLSTLASGKDSHTSEPVKSITNDLSVPYTSSLLTVLPFSAQHSHPIFPTRGHRRSGWYRSKSVASQGLSEITGVDYTTTCWYNVEQLQNVVRDSISFHESSALKSLEDLTEPNPPKETSSSSA